MPITYEPSLTQQVGEQNIQNFGKVIGDAIHPNLEFQRAMQKAISVNPKLAQDLSDLEHNAPGSLRRMGFGEISDVIGSVPESPQNLANRQKRGELVQQAGQKIDLTGAEQGIDLQRINDTVHLLKTNPVINSDAVLKTLGLKSSAERAIDAAHAITAGAEAGAAPAVAEAAKAKAAAEVPQAQVMQKEYESMLKNVGGNYAGTDYMQLATDFMNGKAPANLQLLMSNPTAKALFTQAISVQKARRAQAEFDFRMSLRETNADKRATETHAYDSYRASGYVGSMDAWRTMLTDPKATASLQGKDPATLSQDQRDLLAVSNAQGALRNKQSKVGVASLNAQMRASFNDVVKSANTNAPEAGLDLQISNTNMLLEQLAHTPGQPHFTLRYFEPPTDQFETFKSGKALYFVDDAGHAIQPQEAFSRIQGAMNAPTTQSPDAKVLQYSTYIQGLKGAARDSALADLQKTDPVVYKAVQSLLNTKK